MSLEPGTLEVVELVLATALKLVFAVLLVRWDERRLARKAPELFARTWPPASRLSALVVFQELGVLVHFWRTRRYGIVGLVFGLLAAVALDVVTSMLLVLAEMALGGTV